MDEQQIIDELGISPEEWRKEAEEVMKEIDRERAIEVEFWAKREWQQICPDCGSLEFSHNPLDDTKYICRECGCWFS